MSVAFATVWSVVLLALSRPVMARVLAARISLTTALASAGAGIGAAALVAETAARRLGGPRPDLAFAFTSSITALAVASAVSLVTRSGSLALDGGPGSAPHPFRGISSAWHEPAAMSSSAASRPVTGWARSPSSPAVAEAGRSRQSAPRCATPCETPEGSSSSSARSSRAGPTCCPRLSRLSCPACKTRSRPCLRR